MRVHKAVVLAPPPRGRLGGRTIAVGRLWRQCTACTKRCRTSALALRSRVRSFCLVAVDSPPLHLDRPSGPIYPFPTEKPPPPVEVELGAGTPQPDGSLVKHACGLLLLNERAQHVAWVEGASRFATQLGYSASEPPCCTRP
eukprot:363049-Chlamydomonas_euryale.AAC.5